jgi:hypothetical protein
VTACFFKFSQPFRHLRHLVAGKLKLVQFYLDLQELSRNLAPLIPGEWHISESRTPDDRNRFLAALHLFPIIRHPDGCPDLRQPMQEAVLCHFLNVELIDSRVDTVLDVDYNLEPVLSRGKLVRRARAMSYHRPEEFIFNAEFSRIQSFRHDGFVELVSFPFAQHEAT